MDWLIDKLYFLIPMWISLTLHEYAHAWAAFKLGDDTAAAMGRLTLDPTEHLDPVGSVLLPFIGIPFGWAKPVPVNPARFRRDVHMATGMALTAAAGPLMNLVLAIGFGVLAVLAGIYIPETQGARLFMTGFMVNIGLTAFNLLPIPPLDGSRIVERFVPYRLRDAWAQFTALSPMILLLFILFSPVNLFGPVATFAMWIVDLIVRAVV